MKSPDVTFRPHVLTKSVRNVTSGTRGLGVRSHVNKYQDRLYCVSFCSCNYVFVYTKVMQLFEPSFSVLVLQQKEVAKQELHQSLAPSRQVLCLLLET